MSCGCSLHAGSVTRLSKSVIQKDLETVQRKHLEETILPSILDAEGPLFHEDSIEFTQRLKTSLNDSRELHRNAEAQKRKNVKSPKEKRRFIYSPDVEVVKGFTDLYFL